MYIARAPKNPHKAISINKKRVFPVGPKIMIKATSRIRIAMLAENNILYKSSLFIYHL